ncbi:hypothetical protein [Frateuria aurantia]|uniref:hypothetical protein n=1 Tax=Frateuria aurantia TaxID=81475 RepID=UPI00059B866C|nr:hypothetical protein [Frateuria aurantia]
MVDQDKSAAEVIAALGFMDELPDMESRADYLDLLMIGVIEAMRALAGEEATADWMDKRVEQAKGSEPALMLRRMN